MDGLEELHEAGLEWFQTLSKPLNPCLDVRAAVRSVRGRGLEIRPALFQQSSWRDTLRTAAFDFGLPLGVMPRRRGKSAMRMESRAPTRLVRLLVRWLAASLHACGGPRGAPVGPPLAPPTFRGGAAAGHTQPWLEGLTKNFFQGL